MSCGINHFHEAHPVVHNKLLAISVLYCGIIRLRWVVTSNYCSHPVICVVRTHTSAKERGNYLFKFVLIESVMMPLTDEAIEGELATHSRCQRELGDKRRGADLYS